MVVITLGEGPSKNNSQKEVPGPPETLRFYAMPVPWSSPCLERGCAGGATSSVARALVTLR